MPALIATYAAASGGSGQVLLDAAAGLPDPPLVACPEGPLAERAREQGLIVFALRERSIVVRQSARDRAAAPLRLAGHARELRRLVEDVRPHTRVAWGMRTALAAGPALAGLARPPRLVFQQNDFVPVGPAARGVRRAARRADLVICPSAAVASDLGTGTVVHPGVALERYERGPGGTGALVLGAISEVKRPDMALEVAAHSPGLELTIAGAPLDWTGEELLARLRERAAQPDLAGRVTFTGQVDDPRPLLAAAGCLLHCSDRDAFGIALVEALASGTPVVAPAAGGPGEIADTSCGRTFHPGDAGAAAAAVAEVLANRDELSAGARRRAAEFSVERMRAAYAELLPSPPADRFAGGGLAIVTVAHDSAPELRTLLASVARHLPAAQVIVADSGSEDDSATVALDAGAELLLLDNVGFGRANNAALARVDRPITALDNPDVELIDDSLARLARDADPGRLLAPLLLNPDGTRQESAHVRPLSPAAAAHALVPPAGLPRPVAQRLEPWRARRARRVGWAVGACLVAPTDTLRALGPFAESAFLDGEDLERGLRAAEHGIETWFRPDARVIHSGGHSTAPAFGGEAVELLARRRHEVVEQRLGKAAAAADDLQQLATFTSRGLVKRLLRQGGDRERAQARAVRKARLP